MNVAQLLIVLPLLVPSPDAAHAEALVWVDRHSGPAVVGAIDVATDNEHLWIRAAGHVTTLRRPIAWDQVVAVAPFIPAVDAPARDPGATSAQLFTQWLTAE